MVRSLGVGSKVEVGCCVCDPSTQADEKPIDEEPFVVAVPPWPSEPLKDVPLERKRTLAARRSIGSDIADVPISPFSRQNAMSNSAAAWCGARADLRYQLGVRCLQVGCHRPPVLCPKGLASADSLDFQLLT